MSEWISCKDKLPTNEPDKWSEYVIALSDTGDVFRLSCINGHWQRTMAFIESGSTKVTDWISMPEHLRQ